MTPDIYTPAQVSAKLGLSTGRVYQKIKAGEIPHVRQGHSIRVPRASFEKWMEEQVAQADASLPVSRATIS